MSLKKLFFLLSAAVVMCAASVSAAAASVSMTTPASDITVPAGYPAVFRISVTPADSAVEWAALYKDGEYVGDLENDNIKNALQLSYIYEDGVLAEGEHIFEVRAVINGEECVSQQRRVNAVNMQETVIAEEDFEGDSYLFCIGSKTPLEENDIAEIPDDVLAKEQGIAEPSGKALWFHSDIVEGKSGNDSTVYTYRYIGPGFGSETMGEIGPDRRFLIEYDVYYGSQMTHSVAARKNIASGSSGEIRFGNATRLGVISGGSADTEYTPFDSGVWHHVKAYADMDAKFMDIYFDGQRIGVQTPITTSQFLSDSTIKYLILLWTQLPYAAEQNSYLDNFRLVGCCPPPGISGMEFETPDGGTAEDRAAVSADVSKIKISFNGQIEAAGLKDNIRLCRVENGQEYEFPVSVTEPENNYVSSCTVELGGLLRKNTSYRLIIGSGIQNKDGIAAEQDLTAEFFTETGEAYVKAINYSADSIAQMNGTASAQVRIGNKGGEKTLLIAMLLYNKNGGLEKTSITEYTAETGESTAQISMELPADTEGGKIKTFVMNSFADFLPYYAYSDIE